MPEQKYVLEKIFQANDNIAAENRYKLDKAGIYSLNLVASPGAGKTSLVECTIKMLKPQFRISVINGDIATRFDTDRAAAVGAQAAQINTGGECHLDAMMVKTALNDLSLAGVDLLIIENVGNLVCPASFKLGTHCMVVVASVPEGDDKPYKYPGTYLKADVIILNKIDLLPYVPFNVETFLRGVRILNPNAEVFEVSCLKDLGLDRWSNWLSTKIRSPR